MAKADGDREEKIYHERQRLQLCGVHAINNLFQDGSAMNRELMNSICNNLSPNSFLNPHKSILGVGNYDINALMAALDMKGYEIVWFDKRRSLEEINFENIFGIFVNSGGWDGFGMVKFPKFFRHWFCIRKINNCYYNLDSKLKSPEKIGSETSLKEFLTEQSEGRKIELLFIVEKNVAEDRGWEKQ